MWQGYDNENEKLKTPGVAITKFDAHDCPKGYKVPFHIWMDAMEITKCPDFGSGVTQKLVMNVHSIF